MIDLNVATRFSASKIECNFPVAVARGRHILDIDCFWIRGINQSGSAYSGICVSAPIPGFESALCRTVLVEIRVTVREAVNVVPV